MDSKTLVMVCITQNKVICDYCDRYFLAELVPVSLSLNKKGLYFWTRKNSAFSQSYFSIVKSINLYLHEKSKPVSE